MTKLDIMTEIGAIWYSIATNGDGHKDRDCHFYVECDFAYGEPAKFTAYHYGYVDDGFGHSCTSEGKRELDCTFHTFDEALDCCISETIAMLRRNHHQMSPEQIARVKAILAAEALS